MFYPVKLHYSMEGLRNILTPFEESDRLIQQTYCDREEVYAVSSFLGLKFPIYSILRFRLKPKSIGRIHKDTKIDGDNSMITDTALNIPLLGNEGLRMNWFDQISGEVGKFEGPTAQDGTPFIKHEDAQVKATAPMNQPTLVTIDEWHNIENVGIEVGEIISIRFLPAFRRQTLRSWLSSGRG